MRLFITTSAMVLFASTALAQNDCAAGKTLTEGKLTVATGNPAYYPWVMDDAPESGQGFEAAVAYAVAGEMGFANEDVVWVEGACVAREEGMANPKLATGQVEVQATALERERLWKTMSMDWDHVCLLPIYRDILTILQPMWSVCVT